jgi:GAF domain-containing protein
MALPLVVRGTTIGIIDIQSKQSGAFIQEDVDILSILADQVAIAIENARLFRQTQTALEESQAIVQTYLRQEWSTLSRKQSTLGYLHTGTGGKALAAPMQSDEVEQAIRRGAVVRRERNIDSDTGPALAIPIVLGEQTIGAIRIQSPDQNRDWSPEEINLLRSISERIGLALDNARLVASSQRRASKERTIGEISTKISAATDMDTILQTAVQEIGRALSGADVVIQLQESQEE